MKIYNFIIKALGKIRREIRYYCLKLKAKNKKYTHLYIGSPTYGNLGDQQIWKSSIEFLKANNIKFLDISLSDFNKYKKINFKNIKTVVLQGGGNLGDVYVLDQNVKNEAIKMYSDKKIIVFPQTFYCDDYESERAKDIKEIFSNHKDLTLVAREEKSFEMMKKFFNKNKVIKAPDIVLSSNYTKKQKRRKNVLFLMRKDIEKTIKEEDFNKLKKQVEEKYKVYVSDTVVNKKVNEINRQFELKKVFNKIKKAEFVITDRLHGMVFCAITNTPCIVFSNYNHKVKGTYEWIKKLDYIKFVENIKSIKIDDTINKILNHKNNWEDLKEEYLELNKIIKG